jgi:uncharacterized protein YndB with AHSA1/START domain
MSAKTENKKKLTITRIFDAPRAVVWKAWTDPAQFMRWWGPKNFTTPVSNMDFRVGGKYLNCMRSPRGDEFWSTGEYREIVPLKRIVCTDSFADEKGNVVPASHYGMQGDWPLELLVTVAFEDADGKTKMTLTHEGIPSGEMSENTETGWNESFDKLAASITSAALLIAEPGKQELIYTRVFDAPRTLLFQAYADPGLIPQWWGPKRFATTVDRMEVKPGGVWRFVQHDREGREYAFHGVYHAILSPERIVSTFEFEDASGHISLETALFEEHDGRTKLTGKSVFQSVEDRDEMLKAGMEEGLAETMDRLAELVEKLSERKKAA